MILFGIINFTYTWYDPKGGVGPKEFADMAVELFLNGFAPGNAAKPAVANRRGWGKERGGGGGGEVVRRGREEGGRVDGMGRGVGREKNKKKI